MSRFLAAILALLTLAPGAGAQSVIELRSSARIPDGMAVTLSQIAILTGPEAVALAGLALSPATQPPASQPSITAEQVRQAIDAQAATTKTRVNWGRLSLRGSACLILSGQTAPRPAAAPEPKAPAPVGPDTVRAAVIARAAQLMGVGPDDLKLAFDPADDEFLNLSTRGRTLEAHVAGNSDRLPLALTLFEGNRTVASRTIRVGVQVRRQVLVARAPKKKGEPIGPDDLYPESRWLGPTAAPASADQAQGASAQSRISTGDVVMTDDVAPTVAVNKGDIVAIRCISGSVVLSTRARALASAKDGELVQFQAVDSKRTFFARMDGKGHATVTAGDAIPVDSGRTPARPQRIAPPSLSAMESIR
jgi:flagella basal body P-ring formation protein FlgA